MRGVRNEDSLLFSIQDLTASPPAPPAAEEGHGHAGSGLLDLEGLTRSYLDARNEHAVLGLGAELPEAAVVAAWHPARPAHANIIAIAFAAITGMASAGLILMAAWMWIGPRVVGPRAPARQAVAQASTRPTPEPPAPQPVAVAAPAAAAQETTDTTDTTERAPAVPTAAQPVASAGQEPVATSTQRPARTPATPRPRPRASTQTDATRNPAAECMDEVACLLASNPPACCTRSPSSQRSEAPASPDEEETALPDKLDRAAIQAGIAPVRERVAACQQHGTGTVSLSVRVDADGRVSAVDVKSAPNQALGACAAQAVENARFARSRSGQRFVYPFVF
jgi:TonB family protein